MPIKLFGVMQAPVTPLRDDFSVDIEGLERMIDFHVRHGAPAIAWPHHKAESWLFITMGPSVRKVRGSSPTRKTHSLILPLRGRR